MAKILIAVLASFSLWGGIASQDSKIPCNVDSSYETAEYIESHIDTVKELFIELGFNDSLTSVDKSYQIVIDDMNEKNEGVLLDFNDDNGYLLIGDEAAIYDYVYLIRLSDGWVTYMRYMDLNAYVGFAAFMYY